MKQTAVEWLEKILKGQKEQPFDDYEWEIAFNHAKEMEKEQIIEANNRGWKVARENIFEPAEQYYNETFKSE
jgi:hypothetical protein